MRYNNAFGAAKWLDGVRLDVWGPLARDRLLPFAASFMRWLRLLSRQPWISDADHHSQSVLKRFFAIDVNGAAVSEVAPFASMVGAEFEFVTDAMWQQAFVAATSGQEVPVYGELFYDAVNASAIGNYTRGVMNLVMALETCRDQNFSKIHRSTHVEDRGPQLEAPFDHTNLLKHLSTDATKAFNRDFSAEHKDHWPALRNLYKARHHVAHGKGPVFPTAIGLKRVDRESFVEMIRATSAALDWIQEVAKRKN